MPPRHRGSMAKQPMITVLKRRALVSKCAFMCKTEDQMHVESGCSCSSYAKYCLAQMKNYCVVNSDSVIEVRALAAQQYFHTTSNGQST